MGKKILGDIRKYNKRLVVIANIIATIKSNSATVEICRKENMGNLSIHLQKISKTEMYTTRMEKCKFHIQYMHSAQPRE